ncbi:MAG: FtsX-like permease family protein [Defluviitaleaceae bacterium]|nr:FtsX-like permease family protein [Defluviitaleaceae bacterium]
MSKKWVFICNYSLKNILANKFFAFFSVLSISIGVSTVLIVQLIHMFNTQYIDDNIRTLNGGDISIVLNQAITPDQVYHLQNLSVNDNFVYTLSLFEQTSITANGRTTLAVVRFIDTNNYPLYIESNIVRTLNQNSVIISNNISNRLGVGVGDNVEIFSRLQGLSHTMTILGTDERSHLTSNEYDMNIFGYIYVSSDLMSLFTERYFNRVSIALDNIHDMNVIYNAVQEIFFDAEIITLEHARESIMTEINSINLMLLSIAFITFIVSGVVLVVIMFFSIINRSKEICILKIIGMKRRAMVLSTILEVLIYTVLGNIIGVIFGISLGSAVNRLVFGVGIGALSISGVIDLIFNIFLLSISIAIVFTIIPIIVVGKINVNSILREQQISKVGLVKLGVPIFIIIICLGAVLSIYIQSLAGLGISVGVSFLGILLYFLCKLLLAIISKIRIGKNLVVLYAFRNIGNQRKKFSLALIMMFIGMISLGTIINLRREVLPSIAGAIQTQSGYNAIIHLSASNEAELQDTIEYSYNIRNAFSSQSVQVHISEINSRMIEESTGRTMEILNFLQYVPDFDIRYGNNFSISDERNTVIISHSLAEELSIAPSEYIILNVYGRYMEFEVIGIRERSILNTSDIITSTSIEWVQNSALVYYLDIDNLHFDTEIEKFYSIPNLIIIDLNELLFALNTTLNQQISLFVYISILSIISFIVLMSTITMIIFSERERVWNIGGYRCDRYNAYSYNSC